MSILASPLILRAYFTAFSAKDLMTEGGTRACRRKAGTEMV